MPTPRRKHPVRRRPSPTSSPSSSASSSSPVPLSSSSPISSCSLSSPLPFTFKEAKDNPKRCRKLVTAEVWEEHVAIPTMRAMYQPSSPSRLITYDSMSLLSLDEYVVGSTYEDGRIIGRLHFRIFELLMSEYGWDFERKWAESSRQKQSGYVFDAIQAATEGRGPTVRYQAPDITVQTMVEGGGLIPLLRHIARSAVTFGGKDYHPFVSPEHDRWCGAERNTSFEGVPSNRGVRQMQQIAQNFRDTFISVFVIQVLSKFIDTTQMLPDHKLYLCVAPNKPRAPFPSRDHYKLANSRHGEESDRQRMIDLFLVYGTDEEDKIRHNFEACKYTKPVKQICETCERVAEEVIELDGRDLQWCSACLRLEPPRRVAYCSKDCRDRDWDDGHSRICGKLYTSITQLGKEPVPTEPPHSTSLLWQLFRTPSEGSEHPLPYVHRKWTSSATPDTFEWINNPSAHLTEVLKQVMLRRDRESIRIYVILSWICARLEGDDSWLHAVARQASEEWDLSMRRFENGSITIR